MSRWRKHLDTLQPEFGDFNWSERVSIMEYDGKMSREDAEYQAYVLLCRKRCVQPLDKQLEMDLDH